MIADLNFNSVFHERRMSQLRELPRTNQFLGNDSGMYISGLRRSHYSFGPSEQLGRKMATIG